MVRKLILTILVVFMIFSLVACDKLSDKEKGTKDTEPHYVTVDPISDGGGFDSDSFK